MNLTSRSSTPVLAPLREYEIDPHTGFVPPTEPLKRLPSTFAAWEALVPQMSALLRTSRLRQKLTRLEVLDPLLLTTSAERERALLLLTVFANGWVWGGREPNLRIPRQLAVPLCAVATALDRPPIVHYASMALNNWCRIDGGAPLSADNARMQIQFLGGVDEDWFFIGSLGVELAGASLPRLVHAATLASHQDSDAELAEHLNGIATGMSAVLQALDRMREWCDPYVFYHRVRPYLAGWPAPGAIYEGVSKTPLKYVGGSAGQSSLIQVIDAALGVDHGQSMAGTYLRTVRRYMPVGHRRFVEDVENASCVRARALDGSRVLRNAYNAAIEQVDLFRCRHIEIARDYIANPSGVGADARGTGGTAFADFLGEARRQTISMRISG
jgi:indoleamine 2,3-dioxygenase